MHNYIAWWGHTLLRRCATRPLAGRAKACPYKVRTKQLPLFGEEFVYFII